MRGHKRQNRLALAASIKESIERCQDKVTPLPHITQNLQYLSLGGWGRSYNSVLQIRKKVAVFLSRHLSPDVLNCVNWPSYCCRNLYSIAQKHCMRLSTLRTSCFWYHSFTATALFLIWLHASCFKNCKLTRMTANKLVNIAIQKCCFFQCELSKHWIFWEYLRKWGVPSSLCLYYVVMQWG